jgi:NADH:ubiquinone oxidoreductase subunit F (NADH-binding)
MSVSTAGNTPTCAYEKIITAIDKLEAEGCVKCTPCREGRKWIKSLFASHAAFPVNRDEYLDFITEMAYQISILSICPKGKKLGSFIMESVINNKFDINFHLESGECRIKNSI